MKLNIRYATIDDASQILDIYRPIVETTPISFETEIPTATEIQHRIKTKQLWLVCEKDNLILGYTYAGLYRARKAYQWSVEVSVYVHHDYYKHRIGKALYTSLFALLRLHGYINVYAGVTLPNVASVRLHESLRFTPIGIYEKVGYKFGTWHDVGWWQCVLSKHPHNPKPPITDLEQDAIQAALDVGLPLIKL